MSNSGSGPVMQVRRHEDEPGFEYVDDALNFNEEPYTGVVFSEYPNGAVRQEIVYADGFPCGLCKAWYENGQLSKEWFAKRAAAPDRTTAWHENGTTKEVVIREHGIEIERREWDARGNLLLERKLGESDPMHAVLERMRSLGK